MKGVLWGLVALVMVTLMICTTTATASDYNYDNDNGGPQALLAGLGGAASVPGACKPAACTPAQPAPSVCTPATCEQKSTITAQRHRLILPVVARVAKVVKQLVLFPRKVVIHSVSAVPACAPCKCQQ